MSWTAADDLEGIETHLLICERCQASVANGPLLSGDEARSGISQEWLAEGDR